MFKRIFTPIVLLLNATVCLGQIPKPDDAPQPVSPAESIKQVTLPAGFHLKLIAAEPLIHEVSSVCWDERGRMIVGELHGYNLEGQYDVDILNATGKLDTIARRIQASPESKKKAEAGTYGTLKMLFDTDNDGVMDKAELWADHLPTVYGLCAYKNGVIIVGAPDIIYMADNDGDGKPEVRETLFTGFVTGGLERGINCPMWYFDNWIYVGRGHSGSLIKGPHLKKPVNLPFADFRIKPDGTAIEPVSGGTSTIGHTFTDWGHRAVPSTPITYTAPIPASYLARNPYLAIPSLDTKVMNDPNVFPTSKPHPWRTARHTAAGYNKVYGVKETTPNGFYTSSCGPLIYRDTALPGLQGHYFLCEPAQNMVHRGILTRNGVSFDYSRQKGEEKSEFLASEDAWFHPMFLTHSPDGSICIVDFYREIIEDYSAIPRHLQQQYGDVNGQDKGRIYKLVHDKMPAAPKADMSKMSIDELVNDVVSAYTWRRETAKRMLLDKKATEAVAKLSNMLSADTDQYAAINILYTLDGLSQLASTVIETALRHEKSSVRIQALQLADKRFGSNPELFEAALKLTSDSDPIVQLQLAMSLGESHDKRVLPLLEKMALEKGDIRYMSLAILSSVSKQSAQMLDDFFAKEQKGDDLGQVKSFFLPLCTTVAAQRNPQEISKMLVSINKLKSDENKLNCLRGIASEFTKVAKMKLTDEATVILRDYADEKKNPTFKVVAGELVVNLGLETADERKTRLENISNSIVDVQLPLKKRTAAIQELANEDDSIHLLFDVFNQSTPTIRDVILETVFSRRDQFHVILDAVEAGKIPAPTLNGLQRAALLGNSELKSRAEKLLKSNLSVSDDILQKYVAALKQTRDVEHGGKVFAEKCSNCHQVRGVGFAVGPNLESEFQRAEETYVKDILSPSDAISAGYVTYTINTKDGLSVTGLLSAESANSVTIKKPRGETVSILRRNIDGNPEASTISLMPDRLYLELKPNDIADVIAWIRAPKDAADKPKATK